MAVHHFSGRILSTSLVVSLVAFVAVAYGAAEPARASHFLTHPAEGAPIITSAGPSAAALADQATAQAGARSAAQNAAQAGSRGVRLFQKGAEIKVRKDANLYITSRNIPENDRLLDAYNADRPKGGRVQTRVGEAAAVPGLLGIANQAHRAQDPDGQNAQAYSLADAMRDAIWRKNTAARLKSLTASQSACADGTATKTPSIGLVASC
jgi:hypothetical protein